MLQGNSLDPSHQKDDGFYCESDGTLSSHPPRYSGTLSRHPPRYSGTLSSRPPRYSWNIIETSTSLQLEHYRDIHLVTVGTLSSHPSLVKNHASRKIMHSELIFMHRESIHAPLVNIHALRVNIHASREDFIPRKKFMHREKISYLAENFMH